MSCENERATFENSQIVFGEAQRAFVAAETNLKNAKTALSICEGENGGDSMQLVNALFDSAIRIRTDGGTGSGNCIGETADSWIIDTNRHVAGDRGNPVALDFWYGGDFKARSVQATVVESWFDRNASKDIATIHLLKSAIDFPLPVAPYLTADELSGWENPGLHVFCGGFAGGIEWAQPRSGNVIETRNGLTWYDPNARGGDSGSALLVVVGGQWRTFARTAWSTKTNRGWKGLAMTWERIAQIKSGQVAAFDESLPPNTVYPGEVAVNDETFGL